MASITILNASTDPISIELYYLENNSNELKLKITDFFGPIKSKTVKYPDNCTKIIIEIIKEIDSGISHYMASLEISPSKEKFFKFISYNNIDSDLIEITSNDIKNTPFIKFQNKTLNRIKLESNFKFPNEMIKITNIINKNRNLSLPIPNNIINIQISLFFGSTLSTWKLIKTLDLQSSLSQCYEIIRDAENYSFLLNEINCAKKN